MSAEAEKTEQLQQLLDNLDLAGALDSDSYKRFLDQLPIAIAISDLGGDERVVYVNSEFQKLSGVSVAELERRNWAALSGQGLGEYKDRPLARAIVERLAGRVDALAILYQALSADEQKAEVDLGVYLSQIASAVMTSHAVQGIRLDMKVDTYPVSINVAMPTGLVVNELLTNALKHAFLGREGGTITLRSVVDGDGFRIVVADDGIGLPEGETWPKPGKLGALIAQSLTENAKARFEVDSTPGKGTRVTIVFNRSAALAS
ncbi:ATP-binding protein [Mesorhizobium sp. M0983]|uniref:ATP-binding protein n=1 Tax=unclassified Mesorhizobium TaxID=325217 RepID=UPI00333B6A8B